MKKKQREQEWARNAYVPPRIEVHGAAPTQLMGTSFYSDGHNAGNDPDDDSDHTPGDLVISGGNTSNGAKILGREFNFSDVWEE